MVIYINMNVLKSRNINAKDIIENMEMIYNKPLRVQRNVQIKW